jgi:hypothetical protein
MILEERKALEDGDVRARLLDRKCSPENAKRLSGTG